MDIRAHHLLCMNYFRGKGYNKEFILNFFKVMKILEDDPLITVINSPDVICSSCPHEVNGKCIKKGPDFEDEVRKKDNKIMNHLGLKSSQQIRAAKARKLVNERLENLREVCKECEWLRYCQ